MAILFVPDEYPTIQEAVDAAVPGDQILIEQGTYYERVVVETDNLTIDSTTGIATILDGVNNEGIGITIDAQNCTVKGLKFTRYEIGVYVRDQNNTVASCKMVSNVGNGIKVTDSFNTIDNNRLSFNGMIGIDFKGDGNIITNNRINNNDLAGIGNTKEAGPNTLIENNNVSFSKYGIYIMFGSSNNCNIVGNLLEKNIHGLLVYSNFNNVTNNIFGNNSLLAMAVMGDNNNLVSNVVMYNNDGIHIMGNNTAVFNNSCQNNNNGIVVTGQFNVIRGNLCSNNSVGLLLQADNNIIQSNVVLSNDVGNIINLGHNIFCENSTINNHKVASSPICDNCV